MKKLMNVNIFVSFLLCFILTLGISSNIYAADINISSWPINVVEGQSTKVTVWVGGVIPSESRTVVIKVSPSKLFDSFSQWEVTIPANENKVEFNVKTRNNYVLENDYSVNGSGTLDASISASFNNSSNETKIRIIDNEEENSGDIRYVRTVIDEMDVETERDVDFWVTNFSGSHLNSIKLQITTLGYPKIDMYPKECTVYNIRNNDMNLCDTEFRPNKYMLPGKYYLKIIGIQNGENKFLATNTISIKNDQKPDFYIFHQCNKAFPVDPGYEFQCRFYAKSKNPGFGGLAKVLFYLEHEGNKSVVYNTYAHIIFSSDEFEIKPSIMLPNKPGIYKLWAEINNSSDNKLEETNFSNNTSEIITITVRDNRPVLTVSPLSINVPSVGSTISFDISNTGVQNNMTWSAESNESWMSFQSGQNGIDNGTMVVRFEKNSGASRSGTITVTAPDAKIPQATIQVSQDKDPPPPEIPDKPQFTYNCGNTVASISTPPANTTWYWQSSIDGTDTSDSLQSKTFTKNSTYFIRARMNEAPFYWSDNCQTGTVEVFDPLDAPNVESKSILKGEEAVLHVNDNNTIKWYANMTDEQPVYTGNDFKVSPNETTTYYVSISNEICESEKSSVKVTVDQYIPHCKPVWEGNPYNSMQLFIMSQSFINLNLEQGDEICLIAGDICVGSSIYPGDNEILVITASQDDDTGNGFQDGEIISFKIWDKSENNENHYISAQYFDINTGDLVNDNTYKANDERAVLLDIGFVQQNIALLSGWNICSSYVMPENSDFLSIIEPLISDGILDKVIDEAGNRIIYFTITNDWRNDIGNLNISRGYQIKLKEDSVLPISGMKQTLPFDIQLVKGWNIIGYPCDTPQNANVMMKNLMTDDLLTKVIDEQGNRIIYFAATGNWIDQINTFEPGKGYMIKVKDDCSLAIDNQSPVRRKRSSSRVRESVDPRHFIPVWDGNPLNSMNFYIVEISQYSIEQGDEIGIYDGDNCVGVGIINGDISWDNMITISTSESEDNDSNGFTQGNNISIKFWDASENKEIDDFESTFSDLSGLTIENPVFQGKSDIIVQLKNSENTQDLIIKNPIQDITVYENSLPKRIDLETVFTVPDNETIMTSIFSNDNPALINPHIENNVLIIEFFKGKTGSANIQILATSGSLSISDTFDVNVKSNLISNQTNDIRITNNTGKQFSVINVTPQECNAYLIYGTSIDDKDEWIRVDDDRGSDTIDQIHHITVKNLSYETKYFFEVIFGTIKDNNNGQYYTVTTGSMIMPGSFDTCELSGIVYSDQEQTQIVDNAIVTVSFIGADNSQKSNIWSELVEPEDEGNWKIILDSIRTLDNQSLYPFTCGVDQLSIKIHAGSEGTFRKTITAADSKINDIVLSKVHTINVNSSGNGSVNPSGLVSVNHGNNQSFAIEQEGCYFIDDVFIDGLSVGPVHSYTFTGVMFDHSIEVKFAPSKFSIQTESGPNGNISPSRTLFCGESQSIEIKADDCYSIKDVIVNGESVGKVESYIFSEISDSHTIKASFAINEYSIISVPNEKGTITHSSKVSCGSNEMIHIVPDSCYDVSDLIIDGESVGPLDQYELTNINSDRYIEVEYTKKRFEIISTGMDGGIITPSDSQVLCSTSKIFKITPNDGYEIVSLIVDGQDLGARSEYIFENVDQPHEISVNFGAVYHFIEGWNGFSLRFSPQTPYNSKTLMQAINASSGQITKIWYWDNEGDCPKTYAIDDTIEPIDIKIGEGYFLLSEKASKWVNSGESISSLNYSFAEGLNLFGFPFNHSYKASTLAELMNTKSGNIRVIYRRNGSEWVSHEIGSEFDDFNISPIEAYFIHSDNSFEFEITQ